jgi:hypothetical protein
MHRCTEEQHSAYERRKQHHGTRSMHKSSITNDMPSLCFFLDFNFQQPRWKQPNFQTASSSFFLLPLPLPSPRLPWPWTGDPFSARSSLLLESIGSLASHLPVGNHFPNPESVVSAVFGPLSAESHARSREQGPRPTRPSPFVSCPLGTSSRRRIYPYRPRISTAVNCICESEAEAEAESQNIHPP